MLPEFSLQKIGCHMARPHCVEHSTIRICPSDGALQTVFIHNSSDFLEIHAHRSFQMQEPHIDTARSFCVSAMVIRPQNQCEIILILGFASCAGFSGSSPAVISRARNIGDAAQLRNTQDVVMGRQCVLYHSKPLACRSWNKHAIYSSLPASIIFFTNSSSCLARFSSCSSLPIFTWAAASS